MIIGKRYKIFYVNKLDNFDETNKFLERRHNQNWCKKWKLWIDLSQVKKLNM